MLEITSDRYYSTTTSADSSINDIHCRGKAIKRYSAKHILADVLSIFNHFWSIRLIVVYRLLISYLILSDQRVTVDQFVSLQESMGNW